MFLAFAATLLGVSLRVQERFPVGEHTWLWYKPGTSIKNKVPQVAPTP